MKNKFLNEVQKQCILLSLSSYTSAVSMALVLFTDKSNNNLTLNILNRKCSYFFQ